MGFGRPEKLEPPIFHPVHDPHSQKPWKVYKHGRYHSYVKRMSRRLMRRLGKLLMDDAPGKLATRGWEW